MNSQNWETLVKILVVLWFSFWPSNPWGKSVSLHVHLWEDIGWSWEKYSEMFLSPSLLQRSVWESVLMCDYCFWNVLPDYYHTWQKITQFLDASNRNICVFKTFGYDCCWITWLITKKNLFLTVLGSAKPWSGCQHCQILVRMLFLVADCWLLIISSSCDGKPSRGSKLPCHYYKCPNPVMMGSSLMTSLNPNQIPKVPPPNIITGRIGFQCISSGRMHTFIP